MLYLLGLPLPTEMTGRPLIALQNQQAATAESHA
jgi:hypothetical protein